MMKRTTHMDYGDTVAVAEAVLIRNGGTKEPVSREILREHRLELVVNEQTIARLVCTPDNLEEFVVGRLITEGIIQNANDIEQLHLCESGNRARVFLKRDVKFARGTAEEPTCCTDNRVLLQPEGVTEYSAMEAPEWKQEWICNIVNTFAKDSKLHKSTGGTHSCVLAVGEEIVHVVEDLGRHNAMDKAIGYAALHDIAPEKCILFTTGRVPVDMVSKVIRARIPVLVSKSIPTMDAVEMARMYGLTLICRAWPDSFEIYG